MATTMKRLFENVQRKLSSSSSHHSNFNLRRLSFSSVNSIPQIKVLRGGYNIDLQKVDSSFTKLHKAVYLNNEDRVKKYLGSIGVNSLDNYHRSPLHFAAVNGNIRIIQMLINAGAKVNIQDSDGRTPLIKAIECSHNDVVHVLMDHGSNVDLADYDKGNTALHHCLLNANLQCALYIIRNALIIDYNKRNHKKETFLHLAAKIPDLYSVIEELIANGIEIEAEDELGRTAAQVAKLHNNFDSCELITRYVNAKHQIDNSQSGIEHDLDELSDDLRLSPRSDNDPNLPIIYDNIEPFPFQRHLSTNLSNNKIDRDRSLDSNFRTQYRFSGFFEDAIVEEKSNNFDNKDITKSDNRPLSSRFERNELNRKSSSNHYESSYDDDMDDLDEEPLYSNCEPLPTTKSPINNDGMHESENGLKLKQQQQAISETMSDNMSDLDEMLSKDIESDLQVVPVKLNLEFDNIISYSNDNDDDDNLRPNNDVIVPNKNSKNVPLDVIDSPQNQQQQRKQNGRKQNNGHVGDQKSNFSPAKTIQSPKQNRSEFYKEKSYDNTLSSPSSSGSGAKSSPPPLTNIQPRENSTKPKSYAQAVASPKKVTGSNQRQVFQEFQSPSTSSINRQTKHNNRNNNYAERKNSRANGKSRKNSHSNYNRSRTQQQQQQRQTHDSLGADHHHNFSPKSIPTNHQINNHTDYVPMSMKTINSPSNHRNGHQKSNNDSSIINHVKADITSSTVDDGKTASQSNQSSKIQTHDQNAKYINNNHNHLRGSASPSVTNFIAPPTTETCSSSSSSSATHQSLNTLLTMSSDQLEPKQTNSRHENIQLPLNSNNDTDHKYVLLINSLKRVLSIGTDNEKAPLGENGTANVIKKSPEDNCNDEIVVFKFISKLISDLKRTKSELETKNKEISLLKNNVIQLQAQIEQDQKYCNELESKLAIIDSSNMVFPGSGNLTISKNLPKNNSKSTTATTTIDHNANFLVDFLKEQNQLKAKHYEAILNDQLNENFALKKQCHFLKELIKIYELSNNKTSDDDGEEKQSNTNSNNDLVASTAQQLTTLFNKFDEKFTSFNEMNQQRMKTIDEELRLRLSFMQQFQEEMKNFKIFTSQLIPFGFYASNGSPINNSSKDFILQPGMDLKHQQRQHTRRHSEQISKDIPILIHHHNHQNQQQNSNHHQNELASLDDNLLNSLSLTPTKLYSSRKSLSLHDLSSLLNGDDIDYKVNENDHQLYNSTNNKNRTYNTAPSMARNANLDNSNSFSYKSKYFQSKINELRKQLGYVK